MKAFTYSVHHSTLMCSNTYSHITTADSLSKKWHMHPPICIHIQSTNIQLIVNFYQPIKIQNNNLASMPINRPESNMLFFWPIILCCNSHKLFFPKLPIILINAHQFPNHCRKAPEQFWMLRLPFNYRGNRYWFEINSKDTTFCVASTPHETVITDCWQ